MPVHCPFCGSPSAVEGASFEVEGCEHLMYITSADFNIFLSDKLDEKIREKGWTIARQDDGFIEIKLDGSGDDQSPDLKQFLDQSADVVVFEQSNGPLALHITSTAFACSDEE